MSLNGAVERARWGGWSSGLAGGIEKACPCLVEASGGLIIRPGVGDLIQLPDGDGGLEVLAGLGQGFALLIPGHHVLVAVAFTQASLVIDFLGGQDRAGGS